MSVRRANRGFTLIEAVATTVVLSVIAAVVLPVVNGATEAFSAAARAERVIDDSAYALDRVIRILREAPPGESADTIGVAVLGGDQVTFSDGTGCRLNGDALEMRFPGGAWGELCDEVDAFEIRAFDAGGADSGGSPEQTQRFEVRLVRGGFDLRACAFCRTRYGT